MRGCTIGSHSICLGARWSFVVRKTAGARHLHAIHGHITGHLILHAPLRSPKSIATLIHRCSTSYMGLNSVSSNVAS